MSSNAALRLTLRQKPHLDFVIGYPGLIPDENTRQASLEGTVEVRVQHPVFTKWLKVELKKTETVQTARGIRKYFEVCLSNAKLSRNQANLLVFELSLLAVRSVHTALRSAKRIQQLKQTTTIPFVQEQILWSGEGKPDVDNDQFALLDTVSRAPTLYPL
jgi:hypothetical protein